MQWTLYRGMRPIERLRISVDFTNDIPVGDSALTPLTSAAPEDSPSTDFTSQCLSGQQLAGNILSVVVATLPVNRVMIVNFTLVTAAGLEFQHSVRIPCTATA